MAYIRQAWRNRDDSDPTPLIASRMDYIEVGIENSHMLYESVSHGLRMIGYVATVGELPTSDSFITGDCYIVGQNLYVWQDTAWEDFGLIRGPAGAQGEAGPPGPPLDIRGFLDLESELPATASLGAAYVVGEDLFMYDDSEGWINLGAIRGPQGLQGEQGSQGIEGPPGTSVISGVGTIADLSSSVTIGADVGAGAATIIVTPYADVSLWVSAYTEIDFTVSRSGTVGPVDFGWLVV